MMSLPEGFPTQRIESPRAWKRGDDLGEIIRPFSADARGEMDAYVRENVGDRVLTLEDIQSVPYDATKLPTFAAEIEGLRPQVDDGVGFVIFPEWEGLSVHQARVASWMVDNAFGEPSVQDTEGRRLIEIFEVQPGASVRDGFRYHETREGNSPHTDGVQLVNQPDYLCLRCTSQAPAGGGDILVMADSIFNYASERNPAVISALAGDFKFHARGVEDQDGGRFYTAPILGLDKGGLTLRFLDWYIRQGFREAGIEMTPEQEGAIDYLNSVFGEQDLQFAGKLAAGQQIVFANERMLHARVKYWDPTPVQHIDGPNGRKDYDPVQLDNLKMAPRLMDRTWSYKRDTE